MPVLADLFQSLETIPVASRESSNVFAARTIPEFGQHRIARDFQGAPVLLVSVSTDNEKVGQVVRLENLEVIHNAACTITAETGVTETKVFSVIRCTSDDPLIRTYFMRLLDGILGILGPSPNRQDVTAAIGNLVDLFRALSTPARETVQGLWSELFLIAAASDPISLMTSWHLTPLDVYDFSAGSQRIEVKSSSNRIRQHYFSLAQLQPPLNTRLLIASLVAERAGGGTSLDELATKIRVRIGARLDLVVQLDMTIASTLGISWRGAFEDRFDREVAEASLLFYDHTVVPSIAGGISAGVSDVRFRSNLSGLPTLDTKELRPLGGIIKAVIPFKAQAT